MMVECRREKGLGAGRAPSCMSAGRYRAHDYQDGPSDV